VLDANPTQVWERNLLALAHEAQMGYEKREPANILFRQDNLMRAYARCEETTSSHSRSFYLATSLLPEEKRRSVRALYAFCRTADDIVDEGMEPRQETLAQYKLTSLSNRPSPDDNIATAWAHTRHKYRIPIRYAEQLLEGIEYDLSRERYKSFDELVVYCYRVASTVGLMSMHIIGFDRKEAIPYAIKLGIALQLTNILRDVGEDWRNGRLYLPLDDLVAFGLRESDIAAGVIDDRWIAFMRFQIERARQLYLEAQPGIALLHRHGQMAVASAASLYKGILDDIEAHNYNVFTRRAHVRGTKKLSKLFGVYLNLRLINKLSIS
jgi:15-cis-phytoene synthase